MGQFFSLQFIYPNISFLIDDDDIMFSLYSEVLHNLRIYIMACCHDNGRHLLYIIFHSVER